MKDRNSTTTNGLSVDEIMQLARSFQRSRVLLSAFELRLFTILGDEQKSSLEVAEILRTDARATDRLMNALCALRLLEKRDWLFANTPQAAECLVEGKPRYLSYLAHSVNLWETWSTLTEVVRQGGSVADRAISKRDKKWRAAFIGAMHSFATARAPEVIGLLDMAGVVRILDVGGGSGAYAMEMVRVREGVEPIVFDLPQVIPLTQQYLEQNDMKGKIKTRAGDFKTDDFGKSFDMVFVSSIAHMNSPEENNGLIEKCVRALNHGGQLVIKDFTVSEDRTHPPDAALFALNMLVGTAAGDTYTEAEVSSWMISAGLSEIERKGTSFGSTLIIGRKV